MSDSREWLEADGLGGFASGTVSGVRTRRYHALLLPATTPPTGRVVLVNGFDAWLETSAGTYALSSQTYPDEVEYPNGSKRIERFEPDPWPTWTYRCEDGTRVSLEIFAAHQIGAVCVCFKVVNAPSRAVLSLRPFLSGRDYHALHHENPAFRFDARAEGERVTFRPYDGIPAVEVRSNGEYHHKPEWYRHFVYAEEQARGLDFTEDLAAPGIWTFDLARAPAVLVLCEQGASANLRGGSTRELVERLRDAEGARRAAFPSRLHRAADAYLVKRGDGKTLVAGYPWFTDWGRDTFIAMRGLCLATGRLDEAQAILQEWSRAVSEGMLPNRFSDGGEPEFNAVDASLWFIIAAHEYLTAARATSAPLSSAVQAILSGFAAGTRHRIRADEDGLLAAGEPGVQLTWMDARVGDRVVTPRVGKPVEIQALWLNALAIGGEPWRALLERGTAAFQARFWNAERACLFDVVDVDHRAGAVDPTLRPNQIFAVGGLPRPLLNGARARAVVDAVEAHLWTPLGLRSLAPGEPGYVAHYGGDPAARDGAYHQGTIWPWLACAFIEAFIRSRGDTALARRTAKERFLPGLMKHLDEAGLGHVSEIADGEPPHTPRGCPFQAWSTGELIRAATLLDIRAP